MQKRKKKARVKETLAAVLSSSFHIEIDRVRGGFSILVSGTKSINEFSPEEAVLKTNDGELIISGNNLQIAVYEGGAAEISGGVLSVRLGRKD